MTSGQVRQMIAPQVTGFDEGQGIVEAVAVTYNVTDTYGTRFLRGVFNDSLTRELPPLVWSHNHNRRIGKIIDYKDEANRLVIIGQLDDPDKVPQDKAGWIRKAWRGLRAAVLDEFSVLFYPQQSRKASDGATEFVRARMGHLGLVMEGSVPGAVLLGTRAASPTLAPPLVTSAAPDTPTAPQIAYASRLEAAYRAAGLDPARRRPHDHELEEVDRTMAAMRARLHAYDLAAAYWDVAVLTEQLREAEAAEAAARRTLEA